MTYAEKRAEEIRARARACEWPSPTEHQEQCAVIEWWAYEAPKHRLPEFVLFAIPNAGAGAQAGQAGKMKAEGTRKGIPDLCLAVPRGGFHGLWIEMKRRGQGPRPEQRAVLSYLNIVGYRAVVCDRAELAMQAILSYLAGNFLP